MDKYFSVQNRNVSNRSSNVLLSLISTSQQCLSISCYLSATWVQSQRLVVWSITLLVSCCLQYLSVSVLKYSWYISLILLRDLSLHRFLNWFWEIGSSLTSCSGILVFNSISETTSSFFGTASILTPFLAFFALSLHWRTLSRFFL